jgi:hypothetical protein
MLIAMAMRRNDVESSCWDFERHVPLHIGIGRESVELRGVRCARVTMRDRDGRKAVQLFSSAYGRAR